MKSLGFDRGIFFLEASSLAERKERFASSGVVQMAFTATREIENSHEAF
jgi:hypothetical protein